MTFLSVSKEVHREFIFLSTLKKETSVKVIAVIGRDSPVGWTAQRASMPAERSGVGGIFFPSLSQWEWLRIYHSLFVGEWDNGFNSSPV